MPIQLELSQWRYVLPTRLPEMNTSGNLHSLLNSMLMLCSLINWYSACWCCINAWHICKTAYSMQTFELHAGNFIRFKFGVNHHFLESKFVYFPSIWASLTWLIIICNSVTWHFWCIWVSRLTVLMGYIATQICFVWCRWVSKCMVRWLLCTMSIHNRFK